MPTLVDTSVWIDHFRGLAAVSSLVRLLDAGDVLIHPWVIGELGLGTLGAKRDTILAELQLLPAAPVVADDDVMALVTSRRLAGRGIGWVDAALLASALVSRASLWTNDRRLAEIARSLGLPASD